ncbi:hypothetical protein [Streptacidiphilus sp. P02-A3a]|uniref:hypothetical protein n=1 Tax=Streptacidiphilus sp. P02-A3a TaxID=2704468 RepID=UPI0015FC2A7E|nr:hypothetical protein [Streptacidiphilus sp. P02-A3a]QMU73202.1 hypothetical protein GXP74_38200 [Streptacidiphilus sp. P02-A3a]
MRIRTLISATATAALLSTLPLAASAHAAATVPVSLSLSSSAIAEGTQANVSDFAQWNTGNGAIPAKQVYVQQSANGSSGWSTIGTVPADYRGTFAVRFNATDPHGFWRFYSPAAGNFRAGYSNVVHYFRFNSLITGGRPNATTVQPGQRVTVSGNLWQQGYGGWSPLSGGVVVLEFQPSKGTGALMARTTTDADGHFSVSAAAWMGSGYWSVEYQGSPRWNVMANGPAIYVRTT